MAQKSPKQLTELLERISGSEDLKSEYDDLLVKKKESSESELNVYMHLNHIIKKERQSFKDQVCPPHHNSIILRSASAGQRSSIMGLYFLDLILRMKRALQVKEADDYKKMQTEVADLKAQRYLFELFQIDKKLKSKAEEVHAFPPHSILKFLRSFLWIDLKRASIEQQSSEKFDLGLYGRRNSIPRNSRHVKKTASLWRRPSRKRKRRRP